MWIKGSSANVIGDRKDFNAPAGQNLAKSSGKVVAVPENCIEYELNPAWNWVAGPNLFHLRWNWDSIQFFWLFLFKPVHEVVTVSPEFLPQLFQNLFNLNWFKVSQFIGIREVCFRTKCRMILSWLPWLSSPPSSWSIWSPSLIFLSPMWFKYKYLPPVQWSLCFPGAKIAWTETAEEKF